jgi:glycosyltransferase involved in cell wall biosynthesis
MGADGDLGLAIVIPARNASAVLDACLTSVMPQLRPADQIIVVDDASDDATSGVARTHGATVHRLATARGPYAARQCGADASDSWGLVFLDARCRVGPGWLESHRRLLAADGVAMSCSGVLTVAGGSLASQVAAYLQPFRFEATLQGHRLPYFPTCNLGVRREVFARVGGFTDVRSGGDAELCWRIQDAGLGELAVDREIRVRWVPRDHLRGLAAQMARYGRSAADWSSSQGSGQPPLDWRAHLRAIRDDVRHRRAKPVVIALTYAILAGQRAAYTLRRRATRSRR